MMAVSCMKDCLYKISARIRDILDVVDSYYRPGDETNSCHHHHHHHHHHNHAAGDNHAPVARSLHHHHHQCDQQKSSAKDKNSNGSRNKRSSTSNVISSNKSACSSHRARQLNSSSPNNTSQHIHRQHSNNHIGSATFNQPPINHPSSKSSRPLQEFTKRKTVQGQVYFVDSHGEKYWYDPSVPRELLCASLNLDSLVGRLSSTWEVRQASSGRTYYVNHIKKTTQFTDPRLVIYKDQLMNVLKHANNKNEAISSSTYANLPIPANSLSSMTNRNCLPCRNTAKHNQRLAVNHSNISDRSSRRVVPTNLTLSRSSPLEDTTTYANSPHYLNVPLSPNLSRDHQQSMIISSSNSFINHNPPLGFQQSSKGSKELFDKISILRQELLKQQVVTHPCKIDINRKRIFEESFRIVSQMQARDLKKRLLIKFRGEEGLDYGGVAREWFYLLSREILNPVHGLFQYTSDDIYNLQINPDSGIVYREHLSYMNFCGRIIGMAVFHGHFIEGHFTMPFYKMLLRMPITLSDIELVDPELHRSLCWILENDITNVIDTTFSVQHNAFGELKEHELKTNGKNITVTEENKHEYVSLYVNYRCRRGIASQFEALQRGFYELIPPALVKNFDEYELELLIGGLSKIDLQDWRSNTKLKNCTTETPMVRWFWELVESYNEDKRARLLQFVTGSPRVPIQGFKALQGVNSELRLFTIHLIKNACTDDLPKSHTCFNRIDLPPYETFEKLRDKLTQAIEETMGFAIQ